MSLYDDTTDLFSNPYTFDFDFDFNDKLSSTVSINNNDKFDTGLSFPSPPSSITSSTGVSEVENDIISTGLEFSLSPYDVPSPAALSPLSLTSNTPSLVSPRSSIGSKSDLSFNSSSNTNTSINLSSSIIPSETEAAEALSNHHLQRYLHYKALAAQAEAESRLLAVNPAPSEFGTLLSSCDLNLMSGEQYDGKQSNGVIGYPNLQQSQYYNVGLVNNNPPSQWNNSFTYQPDQAALHRQAELHIQAHESALRMVNASKSAQEQQQNERFNNFYMPLSNAQPVQHNPMPSTWSRDSGLTQLSGNSLPTTPYSSINVGLPMPPSVPSMNPSSHSVQDEEGEDETSEYGDRSRGSTEEIKPNTGMPIPNLHGGGRGYVPGKTPDDPKKRHKCRVCGRGFARAFNLKSHAQTHNPTRPKPFQCPHSTCKRGFSRLHDLERHRQGIHSDGPLVDAKLNGVPPSVARAQNRIQRRAERGALI